MLIRLLPIAVILFSLVNIAHADLSPTDRYNSGYNHGRTDETNGASYYCNSQDHTYTFCQGYNAGWHAEAAETNNDNSSLVQQNSTNDGALNQSSPSQQQPGQPQEQNASNQQAPSQNSTVTSGTVTSGNTAWQEFGLFLGPIQRHTGVYHNENGVFIPWTTLCKAGQSYLNGTCDSIINPDGSLTIEGDKAVGCITNGAIVTAIASSFNMSIDTIKGLLGFLAPHTGCGGIVKLDQIQTSPDLQRLVQFATSLAH